MASLIVAAALATVPFRDSSLLIGRPMSEDGFYALSIARNIATGRGITIDGHTPTNGFQPLFTFLVAGIAWCGLSDRLLLVRAVLVFGVMLHVATAVMLGAIAARLAGGGEIGRHARWATILVYLSLRLALVQHLNGLETGLALFVVSVTWWWFQRTGARTGSSAVILGALCGLAVLARLDLVFLVVPVAFVVCAATHRSRAACAAVLVIPPLALAPWVVYTYTISGSFMPSSGAAQQAWALDGPRLLSAAFAISQNAVPLYLGALEGLTSALVRLLVLPFAAWIAVVFARRRLYAGVLQARDGVAFAIALVVAALVLAAWYALSSWAMHFYIRYLAILLLVSTTGFGVALAFVLTRRPAVGLTAVALATLQAVAYVVALSSGTYVGAALPSRALWSRPIFADQLALVRAHVPEEEPVAAGQSGTLGYFRDHVVNVDGKVNAAALAHQHDMLRYLSSVDVRWFCDMPDYVTRYLGHDPEAAGWRPVGSLGLFRLYRRD